MDCHARCQHMGIWSNLAELRCCCYWVPNGKTSCKDCSALLCIVQEVQCQTSPASQYVELDVPLKHTRVDFTRHLWVREGSRR